jgi:hypothetical protein
MVTGLKLEYFTAEYANATVHYANEVGFEERHTYAASSLFIHVSVEFMFLG